MESNNGGQANTLTNSPTTTQLNAYLKY